MRRDKANMWSRVGVIYLIRLMRKNGTCKTSLPMKSRPFTSLSSHVTASKLTKKDRHHNVTFTEIICMELEASAFENRLLDVSCVLSYGDRD